jgi:hypothetical protein
MKVYKKVFLTISILFLSKGISFSQKGDWKMVEGKIVTEWASKVDPSNPLPEYPRPQMVRGNWKNLNGLWDYNIKPKDTIAPSSTMEKY